MPMPSDAAWSRQTRWAARRWAGVTESRAMRRTTWCACCDSHPSAENPGASDTSGAMASRADDAMQECTSTRDR